MLVVRQGNTLIIETLNNQYIIEFPDEAKAKNYYLKLKEMKSEPKKLAKELENIIDINC